MFYDCRNLITLDLSNFDTDKFKYARSIFLNMPDTTIIKVKNQTMQDWILALPSSGDYYGRPEAWTTENVIIKG